MRWIVVAWRHRRGSPLFLTTLALFSGLHVVQLKVKVEEVDLLGFYALLGSCAPADGNDGITVYR